MKELTILGGFAHRADAVAYQRTLEETTVLVSVLNGPNGFPLTPVCYVPISINEIEKLTLVLESDINPFQTIRQPQEPVLDLGEAPPTLIETYIAPIVEEFVPEPPKEVQEEVVEEVEAVVEKKLSKKRMKDE
jgi:hypothetical protein